MQRKSKELTLNSEDQQYLKKILRTRTEKASRIQRAQFILDYAEEANIYAIAQRYHTNRPKVQRTIHKALMFGVREALDDLPRSGRKERISDAARMWVCALAVTPPRELGFPEEIWTLSLLARYIREQCEAKGHPSLSQLQKGPLSRMLKENNLQPHKVRYYMHSTDPQFDQKFLRILLIYQQVQLWQSKKAQNPDSEGTDPLENLSEDPPVIVSFDEKPGIQVLSSPYPDHYPLAHHGRNGTNLRDYQYERHGTLSLLSGLDLLTGYVHTSIEERHRSREFIHFLEQLDAFYPKKVVIQLILDNHSAHTSKETRAYLKEHSGRFAFIFTPTHASWLNLVEVFFSKLQRCFLKHLRVKDKEEFIARCTAYMDSLNKEPVPFRWKYKLDKINQMPQDDMLFT